MPSLVGSEMCIRDRGGILFKKNKRYSNLGFDPNAIHQRIPIYDITNLYSGKTRDWSYYSFNIFCTRKNRPTYNLSFLCTRYFQKDNGNLYCLTRYCGAIYI